MKLSQVHIHYAPSRDRVLLVHKQAVMTKDQHPAIIDATMEATLAFAGWILREPWEGVNNLPAVPRFLWKLWGRLKRPAGGHKVQKAFRDMYQPNGQRIRFTVEIFDNAEFTPEEVA